MTWLNGMSKALIRKGRHFLAARGSRLSRTTPTKGGDASEILLRLEAAQARATEDIEWIKRRLYDFFNEYSTPLYDPIVGKRTRAGFKMFVDGRDYGSGHNILTDGLIEPDVSRLLPKIVKPGGVFLDVGANFGYYTLFGAMLGGPNGRVLSFEANPSLAPLIERSVYVNGYGPRVKLFRYAVSDQPGTAQFGFDVFAPGGGGLAAGASADERLQKVEVECARIDDLVGPDVTADCIKIDVEGHEFAALRGMESLLRRSPDVCIILEYFPLMHGGGEQAVGMIDYLATMSFSVWRIDERGFLADISREELTRNDPIYILASRKRPNDREIRLERSALQLVDDRAETLTADPGEWLVLGPYWPLPAGVYEITLEGEIAGVLELVATQEHGVTIASRRITQSGQSLRMAFPHDIRYFSVIVRVASPQASLRLNAVIVKDLR